MKKAVRNTLLATSLCFAFGAAAVGLCFNSGFAFAEGAAQTPTQTPIIETIAGASIRYPKKTETGGYVNDGLRFSSTIDKEQYDQLKSDGYTVTTGTFILPWSYYSEFAEINEKNCFTTPTYYWETEEGGYSVEDTTGKLQILNVEGEPYVPEGKTDYQLNGSVLNLKDNSVLNVKFVGVGYIKYEKDGVTDYAFGTTDESNARSVAEVAQKAYYNQTGIDEATRTSIGEAYVKRYIDLYKTEYGVYPTVEYTETVSVETKDGFQSVDAGVKTMMVESYDAKIPGTDVPAMLDGSAKVSTGYVYNSNTTSQSLSISEDDLFTLSPYTSDEGVVTKSTEWSVDGQSLCIDYSKANSPWQGFYGSNTLKVSGRYVSFVAYMEEGYPEFGGSAFWINGSASKEAVFVLEPGVPKRVEIDLGGFSTVNAFAFQKNAHRTDAKLYIDDVRFYDKTVDSVPYDFADLPVNELDITDTIANATPYMYNGAHSEASVYRSSDWSADGKSQSVCFDFANATYTDNAKWMGVNVNKSLGSTYKYLSFTAYSNVNYSMAGGVWISTSGGDTIYQSFTIEAGVANTYTYALNQSDIKVFTFMVPSDKNCKLYFDDIIVYNETAPTRTSPLDITAKVANASEYKYDGDNLPVVGLSTDWSADSDGSSICFDFSNATNGSWTGINLNGYDLGKTYKYMSFTAYCEYDYNEAPKQLWISNTGINETIYPIGFALNAKEAKTFVYEFNSKTLSLFTFRKPAIDNFKIYIDNIQLYNYTEEGSNPGLHTQTFVNGDKTTVVAGFTSLITSTDADVTLTMSIQTADGGEWTTLATEASKCALSQTVDLSALTYCKVKVVAVSGEATISEQVIDLIPTV